MTRPPRMRSGPRFEAMIATFDGCAAAGAALLSIESEFINRMLGEVDTGKFVAADDKIG